MIVNYGDTVLKLQWDGSLEMAKSELEKVYIASFQHAQHEENTPEYVIQSTQYDKEIALWDKRISEHKDEIARKAEEHREWEKENQSKFEDAYTLMQTTYYPGKKAPTAEELQKMPSALYDRFMETREIRFLLDPAKLNALDKIQDVDFNGTNIGKLDTIEMRALYYIIPKNYDSISKPTAYRFVQDLTEKLKDLSKKEKEQGKDLSRRDPAYLATKPGPAKSQTVIDMEAFAIYKKMFTDNPSDLASVARAMNKAGIPNNQQTAFFKIMGR
jgi:hypothetical protein